MEAWVQRLRWIAGAMLAALLLAGCADGGDEHGMVDHESGDHESGDHEAGDRAGVEGAAPAAPGENGPPADVDVEGREVVTTASALVEVREVREAVDDVIAQVEGQGGHVESRREQVDDDGRLGSATLTLRIPAQHLWQVLEDLAELGDVQDLSERAQDVTGTARDLDARIEALETSVERLLEIMEQATTSEDLLQAESSLSERQASLEALVAQRQGLSDQVEMSTLQLEFLDGRAAVVRAEGFLGGLQSGWAGLVAAADGVLVVIGAMLPWLPVLIIVAVVVRWLVRRRRARRRSRAQEVPGEIPEEVMDEAREGGSGGSHER
ncbi:DUF4349 domain-containing protein [Nesterenkonia sp. HG001]|uniref:DUF4349 domain-containing protein n=1 Tax=Nesterenkonia sp. HG001 TaxID=2983207 RepID=UPI002ACC279E|nr:DUF4349 domain-containing protein [Nesterenkonia sp. HG001]